MIPPDLFFDFFKIVFLIIGFSGQMWVPDGVWCARK